MVTGGANGGGGVTIAANSAVVDPEKIKNSDAASAVAQAKGAVANSTPAAIPGTNVQTPTTSATATTGKVPTAADAVLAISSSTPAKQTLLKNTLGAGQAL